MFTIRLEGATPRLVLSGGRAEIGQNDAFAALARSRAETWR